MKYEDIDIDGVNTFNLTDEGGFLFAATSKKEFPSLEYALCVFRKCYIESTTDEFNPLCEKTHYQEHIKDMELFAVNEKYNQQQFKDGLDSWSSEAPEWLKTIYKSDMYKSHLSFQDRLHEGIFESVTKFNGYHLYWCNG